MRKKTRDPILKERCPICFKYDNVGDQGYGRFFCCECCVEFKKTSLRKDCIKTEIYTSDKDGKSVFIDSYVSINGQEYTLAQFSEME